jgi:hypothetical protein
VRNADGDRRAAAERDGDHALRQRAAVGEPGTRGAAGCSARERDPPPGDRVRPGDDLGLVAAFRVDEQQHGLVWRVVDRGQSIRGGLPPGRAGVARVDRADARTERRRERDRRAAGVDHTVCGEGGRPRHPDDRRALRSLLRLGCHRVGIGVARREDQDEPRLLPQCVDRALDGVRRRMRSFGRRGAGDAVADVGSLGREHAADVSGQVRHLPQHLSPMTVEAKLLTPG